MPVLGRASANTLIAYAALALVSFVIVLGQEIVEPSEHNPYLGQAVGDSFFRTAVLSVVSPVIFAGALFLDFAMRGLAHPRRVLAVLALLPAPFWLLVGRDHLVSALTYATATMAIGLLTARFMRLPVGSPNPPRTAG